LFKIISLSFSERLAKHVGLEIECDHDPKIFLDSGISFNSCKLESWATEAAGKGDIDLIKQMMPYVDITGSIAASMLFMAAGWGQLDVVKLLHQDYGINLNMEEPKGLTADKAIHVAAGGNQTEILKYLIDHGVDPNGDDLFFPPLHHAAICDAVDSIAFLIDYGGVDVDQPNQFINRNPFVEVRGETALYRAVYTDKIGAVILLLDRGASIVKASRNGNSVFQHFCSYAPRSNCDLFMAAIILTIDNTAKRLDFFRSWKELYHRELDEGGQYHQVFKKYLTTVPL